MANMSALRRTAIVAGVFYLATEVTSIPALLLYQPVLRDGNYIAAAGADNRALLGGPRVRVGSQFRHLAHRQGLQAVNDHSDQLYRGRRSHGTTSGVRSTAPVSFVWRWF